MTKRMKRILLTILCLPVLPIIGIPGEAPAGGTGGAPAAEGEGGSSSGTEGENGGTGTADGEGNQNSNSSGKVFTQAEVNRMMKAEKESGRRSVLKDLGVEDAKSAKEALAKHKEYLDSQKTEAQKLAETLAAETNKVRQAEQRAFAAECKATALTCNCKPEYVDDLVVLALSKVTEEKDFAAVMKDMQKTHAIFFTEGGSGDSGTGSTPNHKKSATKAEGLGARLAANIAKSPAKNPYFDA